MPRCARKACGHWRPGVLVRCAGLGVRLDDAWYCSARCLAEAARERLAHTPRVTARTRPSVSAPRLGAILAVQKKLDPAIVERAAEEQTRTGLRIGTQLVELGLVSKLDLLRALAAQNSVGFLTALDASRLSGAPGQVSANVVKALRVVPFEADRRHDVLKVVCTAPVPRRSIAALRELTGSIIEPYLVSDDHWPDLLHAYCAATIRSGAAQTALPDIDSLIGKVAEAARESGRLRMSEARCDENLWVRLDRDGRIDEFWLPMAESVPGERASARPHARARAKQARAPRAEGQGPRTRRARTPSLAADREAAAAEVAARDAAFVEQWAKSPVVPAFER